MPSVRAPLSYTADDSRVPPLLTHRRKCGRLRRSCRASWQEARVAVAVGALVSSLSEHVSPEQPDGAQLVSCLLDGYCTELQLVACSWLIVAPAFNCDQDMLGLRSVVRVGRRISVSTRGSVGGSAPWAAQLFPPRRGFEGWCSPRCFGPRTASGSCCGDGGPSLVRVSGLRGAYRPSNAHEDGRPVVLKTNLAYTKMDQPPRQTNGRTAYQSDSVYCPRRPTR